MSLLSKSFEQILQFMGRQAKELDHNAGRAFLLKKQKVKSCFYLIDNTIALPAKGV
jgi:hypothetical protein